MLYPPVELICDTVEVPFDLSRVSCAEVRWADAVRWRWRAAAGLFRRSSGPWRALTSAGPARAAPRCALVPQTVAKTSPSCSEIKEVEGIKHPYTKSRNKEIIPGIREQVGKAQLSRWRNCELLLEECWSSWNGSVTSFLRCPPCRRTPFSSWIVTP